MIIYLNPARAGRLGRRVWRSRPPLQRPVMRPTRGLTGPAVLPLFCLAPHGVFPASRITSRAVSSYLAFATLPNELPARPVRRYVFCDTIRHRLLANAAPACSPRHVAVWCSDFPLRIASERSSAIAWSVRLRAVAATVSSPLQRATPSLVKRIPACFVAQSLAARIFISFPLSQFAPARGDSL